MQESLNLPGGERKEGAMIRELAQILFRQRCAPKEGSFEKPDLPPELCPNVEQKTQGVCSDPCAPVVSSGAEASDTSRWTEPQVQALVVLFTQLAQRRVQAARAQEEPHEYGSYHRNPPRADSLRLRAAIHRCAQVNDHQESTERQYRLRERALSLGWPPTAIAVIDEDQGRSGRSATARTGFQRLVAEVSLGQVGIVLMLEASRLARNSSDWHHLIELCGLSHTLLADESTVYDPRDPNDRLLLGVTGTLSEAELFTLRTRLHEGRWHKARKGLLQFPLPVGFVQAPDGAWELDPDQQVRERLAYLFEAFRRLRVARKARP
jgi:DNA invertase Pin-like site-specific DNA recombinase